MSSKLDLSLPVCLVRQLDCDATMQGCSRSQLAVRAIGDFLGRVERQRRLDIMACAMKAAYGNPGFRRVALASAEFGIDEGLKGGDHTPDNPWWV